MYKNRFEIIMSLYSLKIFSISIEEVAHAIEFLNERKLQIIIKLKILNEKCIEIKCWNTFRSILFLCDFVFFIVFFKFERFFWNVIWVSIEKVNENLHL